MSGPKLQRPTPVPIATSPRRGYRFDEALAARRQAAAQASGRTKAASAAPKSKADTNAAALRLIAEKQALLEEAEAQVSVAMETLSIVEAEASQHRLDSWQEWNSTANANSKANRKRQAAEGMERVVENEVKIAEAISADRFAAVQALSASLGHPNAAEDGNWTILSQCAQQALLCKLKSASHSHNALTRAGYQGGKSRGPRADPKLNTKRRVVAIDCEFVGISRADISVLAQVCAVDALTGEVLLDVLVEPGHNRAIQYRTRYSGLTGHTFHRYREKGLVLPSVAAAQEALFRFVDRDTILVGFSLQNDLRMLEVSHWRVFDPQVAAWEAEHNAHGGCPRLRSLQRLSRELLGRSVQQGSQGHDCLEDVFAARELMLWWLKEENADRVQSWVKEQGYDSDSGGSSTFDITSYL